MDGESGRRVRVREAKSRDAGRGTVRISRDLMGDLGVLSGETVRIEGADTTVATVWPGRSDLAREEVRLDGQVRSNAGLSVGDEATVEPVRVERADRVALAPTVSLSRDRDAVRTVLRRALVDRSISPDERIKVDGLGDVGEFRVRETSPDGPVRVTDSTSVVLESVDDADDPETGSVGVTYEDVGGLDAELEQVRELVELPLSDPGTFRRLGIDPPKGVLMHGPPGTGKTLIARAVANEADAHFEHVSGPAIVRKYKGESEERLREVFETAADEAPSIVFFDEIDAIAPHREDGGDMESRIVAQLLSLMDGLESRGEVVVIGATNRLDAIDPALRRPGRFDREVEIGVPSAAGREEILHVHVRGTPLGDDVDLAAIADRTHGFVGADLRALVAEAAMIALRRGRGEGSPDEVVVDQSDLERALASVDASAMREHVAERPETSFADVGGLADAKRTLRETVAWPIEHGDLFEAANTDPPSGILLFGPPGTGKTLLARAIAHESGVNLLEVAGPELLDRYVGESERAIREVFERARRAAPAVVFFDDIDAIATERGGDRDEVGERVVSQLLSELDAARNHGVVVVAATNRREALDPALLRPGRLETHVRVPKPDAEGRREILEVHARGKPLAPDVDLDALASDLEGYTGADLEAVLRRAAMLAIGEAVDDDSGERTVRIAGNHLDRAVDIVDRRRD
ncbi:MAG: AAA family ATPase [Halanaeroarchaeum sp.]